MVDRPLTNWQDVYDITAVSSMEEFHNGQEVHVWQTNLDSSADYYDKLSSEEKDRVGKLRFVHDKRRYIIRHAVLRMILAAYSNCDFSSIQFARTKYGKPFLIAKNEKGVIQFNMTHSKDKACFVLAIKNKVGIDIEYVKSDFDWNSIANLYFTSKELSYLKEIPKEDQVIAFLNLWTNKEAILKAHGTGLIDFEEGTVDSLINKYTSLPFYCGDNYQGTLAYRTEIERVRFFRYPT
ncbi:4'-phosphopantetheinyl transferase superfamily protein [Aquibacillus halophilus]|uniref:4'-phosphopantetheinyl transferase superfamily protein n=1 Tax=Aquibacillus halophilus TaxID=930132 RepID=A0A6A8DKI2_9BACI|nr:4'-phosphopantetheinyl transferase superfamily protein [Aquibacillus halophilus]MRH44269.1 4'-phosphopantetheinyl transferase superfamily protein [Aquibacillus halophilus]